MKGPAAGENWEWVKVNGKSNGRKKKIWGRQNCSARYVETGGP